MELTSLLNPRTAAQENAKIFKQHAELISIVKEFTSAIQDEWSDNTSIRGNLERIAEKARNLIDEIEDRSIMWIDCNASLPNADDADSNRDVFWLRSGVELLGQVADGAPVDATHWRSTGRCVA